VGLNILVVGATGRLGGVVRELLARGHSVRAMTRSPSSDAADALRSMGAKIVYGDLNVPASLVAAARGVDAVFVAGTLHKAGPNGDIRHGINLIDAIRDARVPHVIYISVAGAETDAQIPLFHSKRIVEAYIRDAGVPHTILAPVYFMENIFMPWWQPFLRRGVYPLGLPAQMPMQQVAIADVTAAAASMLGRSDEFIGERIIVASDECTGFDAARTVSDIVGATVPFEEIPAEQLPAGIQRLFAHIRAAGFGADIPALHAAFPDVTWHRYDEWAAGQDWSAITGPERAMS
jgi:uncharacterized protein YbjT (DUF2867 family)